ncbi:MAG: cob(I)yrinic acid a,c-diamide adenosyltransferase [Candidatus Peribacteraceae bacterium]|nr:cob(I)yrinic acid a,c-diamide adenosyltransferase [Candidatus Peribacteraceae bacterium]
MKPKISTATGDKGDTDLIGKKRIKKSDVRIHAIGSLDELNCLLGVVISQIDHFIDIREDLIKIQKVLFSIGANLADESGNIFDGLSEDLIKDLEEKSTILENALPELISFILPGGATLGALFHQSRSVCRRAERWIVDLSRNNLIDENILKYINRLSDYLFLVARKINEDTGKQETIWKK